MITRTFSAVLIGLQSIKVEVEVDTNRGIPGLILVGLASKMVSEAKERVTASLQYCGVRIKSKRTIVNLAPADIPKSSSHLELAIAIALLKHYREIKIDTDDIFWCGELSLDGKLKAIRGALALVLVARKSGFKHIILPSANQREVCSVPGIEVHAVSSLAECLSYLKHQKLPPTIPATRIIVGSKKVSSIFTSIRGQGVAKRALVIAASGGHNLLLIGPPGVGKSILAQSLPELLPPLTSDEVLEVTSIHSVPGQNNHQLVTTRPFRAPHHSLTRTALIGGGPHQLPGEVSLAHRGVLFLDEFLECQRGVLEALRQPLETRQVRLSHVDRFAIYPAAFSLVLASNPCRCGYAGSSKKPCRCSPKELLEYQRRLSGPLADRIDLCVKVSDEEILQPEKVTTDAVEITQAISQARSRQQQYLHQTYSNIAEVPFNELENYCQLEIGAQEMLTQATRSLNLSHRTVHRMMRVAKTIADLDHCVEIRQGHLAEALQFRAQAWS